MNFETIFLKIQKQKGSIEPFLKCRFPVHRGYSVDCVYPSGSGASRFPVHRGYSFINFILAKSKNSRFPVHRGYSHKAKPKERRKKVVSLYIGVILASVNVLPSLPIVVSLYIGVILFPNFINNIFTLVVSLYIGVIPDRLECR